MNKYYKNERRRAVEDQCCWTDAKKSCSKFL